MSEPSKPLTVEGILNRLLETCENALLGDYDEQKNTAIAKAKQDLQTLMREMVGEALDEVLAKTFDDNSGKTDGSEREFQRCIGYGLALKAMDKNCSEILSRLDELGKGEGNG